jgi:quinohemoprotein ethanol dehydrogenase
VKVAARVASVFFSLALIVVVVAACGGSGGTTTTSATATPETETTGAAETAAETSKEFTPAALTKAASPSSEEVEESPGSNWAIVGGDLHNSRFSSLDQIDTENASQLHLAWQGAYSPPLNEESGGVEEESAPLVSEGVMFVVTPEGHVVAADAADGEKIWEWEPKFAPSEKRTREPTGVQGLGLGGGQVYVENEAADVVAIDAADGKEVWKKPVALGQTELESPAVPSYYEGVVYIGVSGAESARGHVDAYDAKTGKLLWRTFLVCGPTETPTGNGNCPKGQSNPDEGGGSVWTWPAFDVKDGLLFVGTANPSANEGVAGDDKWATSTVALDMKTGKIKWGFQAVHHDIWDYDMTTPPVVFEREIGGQMRTVVAFTSKPDLHFELEARTGKPILPVKEVPTPTSAKGEDPDLAAQKQFAASETQPIPAGSEQSEVVPHCTNEKLLPNPAPDGSKYVYSCVFATPGTGHFTASAPSSEGGQDGKTPLSYDPETGSIYYCESVSAIAKKAGSAEIGGNYFNVYTGWQGSVAAVDVDNNHMAWRDKLMSPAGACKGGDTTTAGGLVFSSANHGKFMAYDARTGKELWNFQGPEDVWSAPVVYEAEGNEYVAMYYGGQGPIGAGMTETHQPRMLVFSVEAKAQPSAGELPKSEFTATEQEALKLAGEGKEGAAKKAAEEAEKKAAGLAGGEEGEEGGEEAAATPAGEIFVQNCGTCHTLAAAGTTGTVGPNLDQLKPSEGTVEKQVTDGGGAMPAFGKTKILTPKEIKEVSGFVAEVAGGGEPAH